MIGWRNRTRRWRKWRKGGGVADAACRGVEVKGNGQTKRRRRVVGQ